ncbi:hypothetical protein KUTeg_024245 [Tegillarca granosa]|uniref:Cyclic nucleotide-binding domain-containing protein n=1 Tax=Tegillarca granosa TaxID=220873 RepID=A0ABQ9DXC4_TEGGR|nr:hypothetical protein KUTeg_024245 [Tegillarca granosa]
MKKLWKNISKKNYLLFITPGLQLIKYSQINVMFFVFSFKPLHRFRKAVRMIQLLLRATLSSRPPQRNDVKFLSWTHYRDEIMSTKRSYEMVGLSFDPSTYRAKKEIFLSNEAKHILSLAPSDRTKDQLKIALLALNQTVEAFSEFPITMQKSLVRVGWYEQEKKKALTDYGVVVNESIFLFSFEDKRVIIRQGHMADNFYFILSGTAIVTKLETDLQSGEEVTRTVAVLKKGNSFGELALMHGARRSATVICKEEVELLAVGREDFVEVFMPVDSKQEPEHIRFLRSVDVFTNWPIEKLPYHDPKICCFTYFRRGLLLCKDSNSSEWLYIIKTGSCRVLKALYCTKPNIKGLKTKSSDKGSNIRLPPLNSSDSSSSSSPSSEMSLLHQSMEREENKRRQHGYTLGYLHNIMAKPPEEIALTLLEHRQTIDNVYKSKTVSRSYKAARKKREREEQALEAKKEKIPKGIEQVAFGMIDKTTSVILVSDGAECILINKKFFKQHLTDRAAKDIRRTYQPLPTEESLQQKLQDKTNWEAYKTMTVVKYISNKQAVYESLFN